MRLILASGSATRTTLLKNAAIPFLARIPSVDERALAAPRLAAGASPAELAMTLAEAKALDIDQSETDALVIGADQTLDLDGECLTKPVDVAVAREQLARLAGHTHQLHSAVVVAENGSVTWRHRDSACLTMRSLGATEIDTYLAEVGARALSSVGSYQVEGPGIRLFETIEGDHFTILGLPLLPLLAYLRSRGALSW